MWVIINCFAQLGIQKSFQRIRVYQKFADCGTDFHQCDDTLKCRGSETLINSAKRGFDIDIPAECGKTDKRSQKMPDCDTFPPVQVNPVI